MDAQHFCAGAGQQYVQELLDSPVTARPLQQPPKAPRRKLPPSYSAAPHPHCQAIPREAYRQTGGCFRSEASNQDQTQSVNPESDLLHLLASSSPISSPEELLARLRAAGTAAATPTAAHMEAERDSDRLMGIIPTCSVPSQQHDDALLAPAELPQSLFGPAVTGLPHPLTRGSWTPALQQNMPGWQQQQGKTHVWGPPAVGHCNRDLQAHDGYPRADPYIGSHRYGGVGDAAVAAHAGPVYGGSPSRPSLSLHGQTSPFAAWSAQVYPGQVEATVASMSCSPSLSPNQRLPLFLSSFDLLSSPPSSLFPFYTEQEVLVMQPQPPACVLTDHDIFTATGSRDMLWS